MLSKPETAREEDGRRPVRLLFVQTQAIAAGAQEISRILAEELARYDRAGRPEFEIHHLFFYRITDAFDRLENVHYCVPEAPRGPLAFLRFLVRLSGDMRRIRPDVVLTFQHYGNIFGAPAARLAGVRRIVANHVSAPATIGRAARLIDRLLGRLGFYDVITANSRETMRDYEAYPRAYTKRLVYVPHGFQDKTVDVESGAARASFNLPAGVPLFGSVARLHPLKQLDVAVAMLKHMPQAHLALAGTGPDEPRLRALAAEAGLAERVHFLGELHPDRVGLFLAGLDVFVFPSCAESFGLAPVEAAQAGIPVVANDLPVLREVLEVDGRPCALFADAADPAAFGAQAARLIAEPALHREISERGRMLSGVYSLEAMARAYRDLILDTGSEPAGTAAPLEAGLSARR